MKENIKISPSLLAADFSQLENEVKKVEMAGADYLHLDVMDGMFVPNISFGAPVIKALRKNSGLVFDVHLMIMEPKRYIMDFVNAGADIITIHYESTKEIDECIDLIHSYGKKAGISIKPATPMEVLLPYFEKLDLILVMTVEPGFGGQAFMKDMIEKIADIRKEIDRLGIDIDLEVDGGINDITSAVVRRAGANVIVAGTAIFASDNPVSAIEKIRR